MCRVCAWSEVDSNDTKRQNQGIAESQKRRESRGLSLGPPAPTPEIPGGDEAPHVVAIDSHRLVLYIQPRLSPTYNKCSPFSLSHGCLRLRTLAYLNNEIVPNR
ncbi:unnamed protein product, partial [Sphacelaria rigidula]